MKSVLAIAAGAIMATAPVAAQDRPAVQHYGNPTMDGVGMLPVTFTPGQSLSTPPL